MQNIAVVFGRKLRACFATPLAAIFLNLLPAVALRFWAEERRPGTIEMPTIIYSFSLIAFCRSINVLTVNLKKAG